MVPKVGRFKVVNSNMKQGDFLTKLTYETLVLEKTNLFFIDTYIS